VLKNSVVSHKNVTKVVCYILVQLSSLDNTITMVSGVSVQVSGRYGGQSTENRGQKTKGRLFLFSVICYLTPDTRNLKPLLYSRAQIGRNLLFFRFAVDGDHGNVVKLGRIVNVIEQVGLDSFNQFCRR